MQSAIARGRHDLMEVQPKTTLVAKLIFVHGFSDHIGRYYELFPTLAARGIQVTGWDQRGWGRSVKKPSEKGLTGDTAKILADVVEVIKSELPSTAPLFIMGHSMGGGIVLALASLPEYQDLTKDIHGWILESPYIALPPTTQPGSLKVFAGRLAGKLLPHMQLVERMPGSLISRDPAVQKSIDEDELCHGTGTLEMFTHMLDRGASLVSGKYKLNKGVGALWLAHGTADQATSYDASKKWFDAQKTVPDKTFKSYEGWSHTLHSDLPDNRGVFAQDVGDWILARAEVKGDAPVASGESKL
jgi:acylglycerol lipase